MSSHTQSKKRHCAGQTFLTPKEKKVGTPWYASKAYQLQKNQIKERVARKVELAHARSTDRLEYAKEHGLRPSQVSNKMIGFV